MGFLKDFKAFLMKGDIIALATAVIIGGAFNKIVGSLVKDIIMPVIGVLMGGKNVNNLFFSLDGGEYETVDAAVEAGGAILTYGNFLQAVIDFIIIGFVIFWLLKGYEKTKKKEEAKPAAPKGPTQEELLIEIRDELRKK
ncbi:MULTISPECIES: large conductance mechanosensitive channel protein MscL [unclassified Leeuwenhoekiella]|uniref:large conductance mechanosensitive channel protein MscL n=1 Tax=unclassified Leeuwenhoekiella TaxID=2615029 RepID=UPI000C3529EA|nr:MULTISPECIES: large conductance mechanosensitive channel protein MscL [unclassified Leeuwenhoekiella]MAW95943.1 large conductance mechanosensitive channel protein MscL [Leeuwenhoekiella sp.]MBA79937.1 large conductance mechanosensitive channel protein MscL [Leeuwenhoekiella sp.]|tara:strand:- start:8741 stop:9160 length:420 start_codon:yes stop_codon:yes gene_type:complete